MNREKNNDTKGCPLFSSYIHNLPLSHTFSLSLIHSHSHTLPHYLSHFYTHIIFLANIFSVTSIHKHLTCILTYKLTFSFVLSDYSFCFLSQPLSFLSFNLFPSIISLFACLCVGLFYPLPFQYSFFAQSLLYKLRQVSLTRESADVGDKFQTVLPGNHYPSKCTKHILRRKSSQSRRKVSPPSTGLQFRLKTNGFPRKTAFTQSHNNEPADVCKSCLHLLRNYCPYFWRTYY